MVLGYFDGCVEQLPCDEMIPCYDPQQEANTPEDVALLARALGGSAHEAQRMIAKYPGEITFDRDRNAVQIIGCNDAVKAHLPLQPAVAQARPSRLRGALTFVAGVVARARYLATTLA